MSFFKLDSALKRVSLLPSTKHSARTSSWKAPVRRAGRNLVPFATRSNPQHRYSTMSSQPPKHEMVYLKGLASEVRKFGQFRKVIHTGLYSQLVAMEIPVGGDIGDEVHLVDQVLLFTSGKAKAVVAGKEQELNAGDVVVVPAGTQHQFYNTGDTPLELITVYSPAEHDTKSVHQTKEEGDEAEESGKDEAPDWSRRSMKENEEKGLVNESGKY